jgi:YbbR domain-containing protein
MKMQNRLKKHSLKFISAFLSVFLWMYVLNSEKVKFEKTVALEYILPVDMMFADKPVQEVTFLIEGPRAFVRTVTEREDRLIIDLNRANTRRELSFNVDINPTQLSLPFGMVVERVLPRRLNIRLEKKASKIVPLKLQFTGSLPDKLSLHKTELDPSEVEVYGPRTLISKLKELSVKPIELDALTGQDQIPVEVHLPDDRLTLTGGFDVKFGYQLKAASSNFTLRDLPIKFLSEKRKISSSVKVAQVKLLIPEKAIKNRSNVSSSVQVWADVPDGARGRVEVPLKVILPPTIHLLEITPKSIIVNIQ